MYFARTILFLIVAAAIGFVGYQIGIDQNVAAQLPPAAAPVAYYGYPHQIAHGFASFFGFLFTLFFIFLFFGLLRAAFFGGRGWGNKGSHYWGARGWADGVGGPGRERIEALHRELHGEKPTPGGPSGGPSGPAT